MRRSLFVIAALQFQPAPECELRWYKEGKWVDVPSAVTSPITVEAQNSANRPDRYAFLKDGVWHSAKKECFKAKEPEPLAAVSPSPSPFPSPVAMPRRVRRTVPVTRKKAPERVLPPGWHLEAGVIHSIMTGDGTEGGSAVDGLVTTTTEKYSMGLGQRVLAGRYLSRKLLGYLEYARSTGTQKYRLVVANPSPLAGTYNGNQSDSFQYFGTGMRFQTSEGKLALLFQGGVGWVMLTNTLTAPSPFGAVLEGSSLSFNFGAGMKWQFTRGLSLILMAESWTTRITELTITSADVSTTAGDVIENGTDFSRIGLSLGLGYSF